MAPDPAPGMTLPDVSGLAVTLPWYVVDRAQGRQPFAGDPARALLDLWPLFRDLGPSERDWTGNEEPLEVLTALWRDAKGEFASWLSRIVQERDRTCEGGGLVLELDLEEDERGPFVSAVVNLEFAMPDDFTLYWADLRYLARLREYSPSLWDFAQDGLSLLGGLDLMTFEDDLDMFGDQVAYTEEEEPPSCNELPSPFRCELEELNGTARAVLSGLRDRAWKGRKDLRGRFERRVRRAAVGPGWVAWGRDVLTAVGHLSGLWGFMEGTSRELEGFDGVMFTQKVALSWGSPLFFEFICEVINSDWQNGGYMAPCLRLRVRGSRKSRDKAVAMVLDAATGLTALRSAMEGFQDLCVDACGEIDDSE